MARSEVHFSGSALGWQEVLNSLQARDRPDQAKLPVLARLVWEHDGEEWKVGNALRLDLSGPAIFVELSDKRCKFTGVWLHPDDVWWEGEIDRVALPKFCPRMTQPDPR